MAENIEIMTKLERVEQLALLGAKDVFTTDDVVAYTGFTKAYIYKLVCLGEIPHYKCGGKMNFFRRDEINAWLTQNRVPSKSDIAAAAAAYVVNNPVRKGGRK